MEAKDIITVLIALYGAILATYTQVKQRQDKKPHVKVKLSMGLLGYQRGQTSDTMLIVEAANIGLVPVTLGSQGIVLPDSKQIVAFSPGSNVTFPHELQPGKSCMVWMDAKSTINQLKANGYSGKIKLVPQYKDQADNAYKGTPMKLDLAEWSKDS